MEIITYVRSGAITHRDSMGNTGRTAAGDVQVMSAGTGVTHSEFNLEGEETTLFQIWIMPDRDGGNPGWGARQFPKADRSGQFVTLASGIEGDEALPIRANARVAAATVSAGESVSYDLEGGRHAYLVAAKGEIASTDRCRLPRRHRAPRCRHDRGRSARRRRTGAGRQPRRSPRAAACPPLAAAHPHFTQDWKDEVDG
jgi:redox-sensitive bicupin YhaK (pirin superfamily)